MQSINKLGEILHVEVNDGITLRYLKTGNGTPMILLHTIRTQLDYFQEVIPALAQHYTIYAVDLPGHGYSSIDTKASYDEPYFRAAIIAFIEKLNLTDVTFLDRTAWRSWTKEGGIKDDGPGGGAGLRERKSVALWHRGCAGKAHPLRTAASRRHRPLSDSPRTPRHFSRPN